MKSKPQNLDATINDWQSLSQAHSQNGQANDMMALLLKKMRIRCPKMCCVGFSCFYLTAIENQQIWKKAFPKISLSDQQQTLGRNEDFYKFLLPRSYSHRDERPAEMSCRNKRYENNAHLPLVPHILISPQFTTLKGFNTCFLCLLTAPEFTTLC